MLVHEEIRIPFKAPPNKNTKSVFGAFHPPTYSWYECREGIHSVFWKVPVVRKTGKLVMAFKFGQNNLFINDTPRAINGEQAISNLAALLDYVERERMGWADRSKVHSTQYRDVALVVLSPGWLMNTVAFSLSTIFMRLALVNMPGTSFDFVLNQYDFSKGTRPAIDRFLAGYYHFTGHEHTQWFAAFYNKTAFECQKLLIHRSEVEDEARKYWAAAGCPEGRDDEFFLHACEYFHLTVYPRHWH